MASTYEIIKALTSNNILDSNIHVTTLAVQGIAMALAPILFAINIMHNFWGTTTSFAGQLFNKKELIRLWVVWGFICFYPIIFSPVMIIIDVVNKASSMSASEEANYSKVINDYASNHIQYSFAYDSTLAVNTLEKDVTKAEDSPAQSTLWDILGLHQAINFILNSIICGLAGIVHIVIGIVAVNLHKVLYVLGPMAFCFSLSPFSKNQVDAWLGTFLNTGFVLFTFNILERLLLNSITSSKALTGDGVTKGNPFADTIFGLVILILYLCVFWLTSKFVGSGDGGKVLSTAMQAAQTAAQFKMASNMGKGTEDSTAGDAAKSGADSMKKQ